jgi:hypothetical protein
MVYTFFRVKSRDVEGSGGQEVEKSRTRSIRILGPDYEEIVGMARSEGRTIQGMVHRLVVVGRERRVVRGDTGEPESPTVNVVAAPQSAVSAVALRRQIEAIQGKPVKDLKVEPNEWVP